MNIKQAIAILHKATTRENRWACIRRLADESPAFVAYVIEAGAGHAVSLPAQSCGIDCTGFISDHPVATKWDDEAPDEAYFDIDQLHKFIKRLKPASDATLIPEWKEKHIIWHIDGMAVRCKTEARTFKPEDNPPVSHPPLAGDTWHMIPGDTIMQGINTTHAAMNTGDRYYLNGIYIESDGFTATDGHIMLHRDADIQGLEDDAFVLNDFTVNILRMKPIREYLESADVFFIKDDDGDRIHMVAPQAGIAIQTCARLSWQYPDWRRVIPGKEKAQRVLSLPVNALKDDMKMLGVASVRVKASIGFHVDDNALHAAVGSGDTAAAVRLEYAKVAMGEKATEGEFFTAYAASLLTSIINALGGDNLTIWADYPGPSLIRGDDKDTWAVIMPVRYEPDDYAHVIREMTA